jgi:hypothetical protein
MMTKKDGTEPTVTLFCYCKAPKKIKIKRKFILDLLIFPTFHTQNGQTKLQPKVNNNNKSLKKKKKEKKKKKKGKKNLKSLV